MGRYVIGKTEPTFLFAQPEQRKSLSHGSGGTVYYKSTPDVSPESNDGTLEAGGASATVSDPIFLLASGTAHIFVEDATTGVKLGPTVNTGQIFQGIGGYNPDGDGIENQGTGITTHLSTGGLYEDSDADGLFHLASYVENTGSRPTVAVFGAGKGKHVFGGNFIGYTDGADHSAIGIEVDFGNLNKAEGGVAHGIVIKSLGGNVGGQGGENYDPDEAARTFWEAIARRGPELIA